MRKGTLGNKTVLPCTVSTLDYWFIPATMDAITKTVEILTSPKSDHLAVHMCLSFDTAIRGDGYWSLTMNGWIMIISLIVYLRWLVNVLMNLAKCYHQPIFGLCVKTKFVLFVLNLPKIVIIARKVKCLILRSNCTREAYVNSTKKS